MLDYTLSMTKSSQIALAGIQPGRSALGSRERTGALARLAMLWRATMNLIAPLGYEDESGFHFGEMPDQTVRTENS